MATKESSEWAHSIVRDIEFILTGTGSPPLTRKQRHRLEEMIADVLDEAMYGNDD